MISPAKRPLAGLDPSWDYRLNTAGLTSSFRCAQQATGHLPAAPAATLFFKSALPARLSFQKCRRCQTPRYRKRTSTPPAGKLMVSHRQSYHLCHMLLLREDGNQIRITTIAVRDGLTARRRLASDIPAISLRQVPDIGRPVVPRSGPASRTSRAMRSENVHQCADQEDKCELIRRSTPPFRKPCGPFAGPPVFCTILAVLVLNSLVHAVCGGLAARSGIASARSPRSIAVARP
jgi:hypothetical protein